MGLTLRKLERQNERLMLLRNKIKDKYGVKGLHIAQLIQNGFFNRFLATALERIPTTQQLKLEIKSLLENIENTVVFVKETDNVDYRTKEITTNILANSPRTFIICSSGHAMEKYRQIENVLKGLARAYAINYEYEHYEGRFKRVLFLNKKEEE